MESSSTAVAGVLTDLKRTAWTFAGADAESPATWAASRLPALLAAVLFVALFEQPFVTLARDWWTQPEAGHGLLLAPVAVWLAWRSGIRKDATPNRLVGGVVLVLAVLIRCAAGLAAELFTMRGSMVMALVGLTVYHYGIRQVLHWWLPFVLASLSIPLPELVTQALALPLQFRASRMGAALLQMRGIPIRLDGNVIRLPGQELFVTEACSGLRSLTALLSVGVLMSAMVFRSVLGRAALVALAIPIAIVVNGIRVFLTGFLVFFVSPELGKGFMHETEGWGLFLVSMSLLAAVAWAGVALERRILDGPKPRPRAGDDALLESEGGEADVIDDLDPSDGAAEAAEEVAGTHAHA